MPPCFNCWRPAHFTQWLAARCNGRRSVTQREFSTTLHSGCSGERWAGSLPTIPSSTLCRLGSRPSCTPSPTAPIWQFRSFGNWVALLLSSLLGLFAGIGLRVQTFVWLGLVTFLVDVLYELGRVSLDHALAKWAIMLSLGILLVFFVALNEKKQIVATMRGCFDEVRTWE